jgi:hypothetical protein
MWRRRLWIVNQNPLIEKLLLLNCHHHCVLEEDGKCYSSKCLMCVDPELREVIARDGCVNFKRYKEIKNICSLETCCLTQEKNEPGPCEWAITNEAGEPDCGYG